MYGRSLIPGFSSGVIGSTIDRFPSAALATFRQRVRELAEDAQTEQRPERGASRRSRGAA